MGALTRVAATRNFVSGVGDVGDLTTSLATSMTSALSAASADSAVPRCSHSENSTASDSVPPPRP